MRLIIPTAKVIPAELQNVGKIPAIIYPIGTRIVFDYLYEHYRGRVSSCRIIAHDNIQAVQHQLRKYLGNKTKIIVLPELGDLGDTIKAGLPNKSIPVLVNFGDTILDTFFPDDIEDGFFYATEDASERWTSFEISHGVLTNIYDKGMSQSSSTQADIFIGIFKFSDASLLAQCMTQAIEERAKNLLHMDSFYRALQLYSNKIGLTPIFTQNWFDIGHLDRYNATSLEVKARAFNHIEIDRNRGLLRKTSENREKFIGEIQWYLKLPADIEYVRPRIFDYSLSYDQPYVVMEYYAYHTLHELFLYGDLSSQQWRTIFKRVLFILSDMQRYKVYDDGIRDALKSMYLDKTIERLHKLNDGANKRYFANFFTRKISINGVIYPSLSKCCQLIKEKIPELLLDVPEFTIIHGDLCFANIMIDEQFSFLKLIDPRGKFGKFDIYGDARYELAKLFHSVDGKYDFIIKDQFTISVNPPNATIDYYVDERPGLASVYNIMLDTLSPLIGDNRQKIELIEALLFLSMVPLHHESRRHQYAMLATGILLLDRVFSINLGEVSSHD